MGICEGIPSSIMPDHLGRADYHGTCINQAARFMDAGAMEVCGGGRVNQGSRLMDSGVVARVFLFK